MPGFGPPGSAPLGQSPEYRPLFVPVLILEGVAAVASALGGSCEVATVFAAAAPVGATLSSLAVVARSLDGVATVREEFGG